MGANDPRKRIVDNPFYVLGLPPECSRAEIEREGQKLLGMLELGLSAARLYRTPLGSVARTPEKVREAMAELRDPDRRLMHEAWARLQPATPLTPQLEAQAGAEPEAQSRARPGAAGEQGAVEEAPASWAGALALLGWRRR